MALTQYFISQKVTVNGEKKYSSFNVELEPSDMPAFLGLLEGGYTVSKVDDTLTNLTSEDTSVSSVNAVSKITMVGKDSSTGRSLFNSIKPYKGVMWLKNTVDSDSLNAVLSSLTPFYASQEKPTNISALYKEVAVTQV